MYTYQTSILYDSSASLMSQSILLLVSIFSIVVVCMTFERIGLAWWKALIPFYGVYALIKKVWDEKNAKTYLWLSIAGCSACMIALLMLIPTLVTVVAARGDTHVALVSGLAGMGFASLLVMVGFVLAIIAIVWKIRAYARLSKMCGHGDGFTVGLVLVPVVFFAILAFEKRDNK